MNKSKIFFISVLVLSIASCSVIKKTNKIKTYVKIETGAGSFIVGLYEGTPEHKKNFIKNINEHVYDSTLVYSTIPNGLYRLGLPENLNEDKFFDEISTNDGLKNEINDKLIHKTGAVGMLRIPNSNSDDRFSNNQLFYLCQGIDTDAKTLKTLEAKRNAPLIADYITVLLKEPDYQIYKDSLDFYKANKLNSSWTDLYVRLTKVVVPRIEADGRNLFELSEYQIKTYSMLGGAPIYDGQHVIFGEIVYGIEILDKLAEVKTGLFNKPRQNVYILSGSIVTKKEFKKLIKLKKK